MAQDIPHAELLARTQRMRALSDADRVAAIDAAPNVVGFTRFCAHAQQRHLATSYRKPIGGGHA